MTKLLSALVGLKTTTMMMRMGEECPGVEIGFPRARRIITLGSSLGSTTL
ncbi:hypothetical protein A2U01_0118362, partial [Trifolium medium]|nr:hypothetical protein [Trifolium medium]